MATEMPKGRLVWMFKWLSLRSETKKQHKALSSASVRSVLKTAVADAEQIVASIKIKAQSEAEEEAARIIAEANQDAEEIKRRAETAAEKKAEDIPLAANSKAEITEVETKQKASQSLLRAREEIEELIQPQAEIIEEKAEEPAQPQAEIIEEKTEVPDSEETEPDLLTLDSRPLYTGEVELAISVPVDLKMLSILYNYLQTTPEIKFSRVSGSRERGITITVVLDKPIPLISAISSKVPGAKATPERPEKDGYVKGKRGVRRIKLALKEG